MGTVHEAWRVVVEPAVLAETAAQGERIVRALDAAETVCCQVWQALADTEADPDVEDHYDVTRRALTDATSQVHTAAVRLRHLAG